MRALLAFFLLLLSSVPARAQGSKPPNFDALAAEATTWLQEYLRIRTVNPPGNETEGAKFLQAVLAREGIPSEILESEPGRGKPGGPAAGHRRPASAGAPQSHRRRAGGLGAVALPALRRRDRGTGALGARGAGHQGARYRANWPRWWRSSGAAWRSRVISSWWPIRTRRRAPRVRSGSPPTTPTCSERGVPAERGRREPDGRGRPDRVLRPRRHREGAVLGAAHGSGRARPRQPPTQGNAALRLSRVLGRIADWQTPLVLTAARRGVPPGPGHSGDEPDPSCLARGPGGGTQGLGGRGVAHRRPLPERHPPEHRDHHGAQRIHQHQRDSGRGVRRAGRASPAGTAPGGFPGATPRRYAATRRSRSRRFPSCARRGRPR